MQHPSHFFWIFYDCGTYGKGNRAFGATRIAVGVAAGAVIVAAGQNKIVGFRHNLIDLHFDSERSNGTIFATAGNDLVHKGQ